MRVPTLDVSVVDLTVNLAKPATYDEICAAMKEGLRGRAEGHPGLHRGRRGFLRLPGRHPHLHLRRHGRHHALTDTFVKVVSWYDNEIGYSNKVLDLITHMYSVDHK